MTKTEYNKVYYEKNAEKLRQQSRDWYSRTIETRRAYDKARYPDRRESELARHSKNWRDPEKGRVKRQYNSEYCKKNKKRLSENGRKWRQKNADYKRQYNLNYMLANPCKVRVWTKKWSKKNPDKVKSYDVNRRARKLGATSNEAAVKQFFTWIKNQDYVTCTYCGKYIIVKSVHIDHIIPLSRGGRHDPDNFAVSCGHCNQSKSDSLLSEWNKCPEKFKNLIVN